MKSNIQLLNIGYNDDLPSYLKRKVFPANLICLILFCSLGIPFTTISLIYFPPLAIFPGLGSFVIIIVFILNYFGQIYFSRFLVSLMPITLATIYNAYLSKTGEQPISSLYLCQIGLIMIPYVIFDVSEKIALIFISIVCASCILSFPLTNAWFEADFDATVLRTGWLSHLTILMAIFFSISSILGLAFLNKQSETESLVLFDQMNEKNKILETSELKLKEYIEKIEDSQMEEQQRNWISEGLAKSSKIMRNTNNNLTTILDAILVDIIKYLEANQGGIFVLNDTNLDDLYLELVSCYAYERKKYLQKKIYIYEGLLGECYLEKDIMYLTKVPDNYINITSGLGKATPTCLLICPLIVNDVVFGVIELAFFKVLEKHEIEFVKKIAENIAAAISTVKTNEKTKSLLAISQQQTEELRAQEEEMRQNMEELQATQEETERRKKEIEALLNNNQNTLDRFNTILEASPEGIFTCDVNGDIDRTNNKFYEILEIQESDKPNNLKIFLKLFDLQKFITNKVYTQKLFLENKNNKMVSLTGKKSQLNGSTYFVFFFRDITLELKKEQELIKTLEQLELNKSLI